MAAKENNCTNDDDDACCWICLGGEGPLASPCSCPRRVHLECLARWQLHKAGTEEERKCRFCARRYPDWREQVVVDEPEGAVGGSCGLLDEGAPVELVVSVGGKTLKMAAAPGELGKVLFAWQVVNSFGLAPFPREAAVSFLCRVPWSPEEEIWLSGLEAFDAAVHCAAVHAARLRLHRARLQPSRSQQNEAPQGTGASAIRSCWGCHGNAFTGDTRDGHSDDDVDSDPGSEHVGSFDLRPATTRPWAPRAWGAAATGASAAAAPALLPASLDGGADGAAAGAFHDFGAGARPPPRLHAGRASGGTASGSQPRSMDGRPASAAFGAVPLARQAARCLGSLLA